MRPYFTVRDIYEQARIWRRPRSGEEIKRAVDAVRAAGAPFIADAIISVGPQSGDRVRAAFPGKSWHQFGLAMDCFWLVEGRAEWKNRKGYKVYHRVAKNHGLYVPWPRSDAPHIQMPKEKSPRSLYTWPEIDEEMRRRYK